MFLHLNNKVYITSEFLFVDFNPVRKEKKNCLHFSGPLLILSGKRPQSRTDMNRAEKKSFYEYWPGMARFCLRLRGRITVDL